MQLSSGTCVKLENEAVIFIKIIHNIKIYIHITIVYTMTSKSKKVAAESECQKILNEN